MTNEEKVELRMLVMSMARTYRREEAQIGGKDTEQRFQTINDGRDSILSLIDRQPSEEDKAEIDNWMRSLRIGDPESDDDALHVWHILTTIRKALGIEGKE